MAKHLFFDDSRLYVNQNTERRYVTPELAGSYVDSVVSTDYPGTFIIRRDDGKYILLYQGHSSLYKGLKLFCAESDNGIDFKPMTVNSQTLPEGKMFPHEIMSLPEGNEVGFIFHDSLCENKAEKYKMLLSDADCANFVIRDRILVSPDLIHWSDKANSFWGNGTEPLVSCFYNKHRKCYTILNRPFWGVRRVGYTETVDWHYSSEWQPCAYADSLDEPLSEVYGMYGFEYEGMYIGLPHIYRGHKSEKNAKFHAGLVDPQLAYSYDGRYWQRSLRTPFISCGERTVGDEKCDFRLMWVMTGTRNDDGSIYLYAAASMLEHGPAFRNPGQSKILIFKVKPDRFIALGSKDGGEAVIATREKVWNGGELTVNLSAEAATCAVYETLGDDCLGFAKAREGFSHEDCEPFSGDSTSWIPKFKNGRCLDEFAGKTVVIEVKFRNGEIYSLTSDSIDAFNTQAARFRVKGLYPNV